MKNIVNGLDIPMGLGMALAQNPSAMNYFSSLTQDRQRLIIDKTHNVRSKEEMRSLVEALVAQA